MEQPDRTERLLALLLLQQMKGASQREKVAHLNIAGFSNVEIADILDTTAAVVSQALYESRQGQSRRGKGKSRAKSTKS